jgi:hypothetical protein
MTFLGEIRFSSKTKGWRAMIKAIVQTTDKTTFPMRDSETPFRAEEIF